MSKEFCAWLGFICFLFAIAFGVWKGPLAAGAFGACALMLFAISAQIARDENRQEQIRDEMRRMANDEVVR